LKELLEAGTFFIWLFITIAPAGGLLLLWRGITRARQEAPRRAGIVLATLGALGLWLLATQFTLDVVFDTAWGLAHTRPFPSGRFPEGWPVYGCLAAYSVWGAMLIWVLGKYPRRQTSK
jgi:hypothetical protein